MAPKGLLVLSSIVIVAGCAATPEDPNRPVQPACDRSSNCFYERNIRSFQVLDDRTLVVLVGRNQCPYRLELDGFFCDISMSSFIAFDDSDGRICTWDRAYVVGGPFFREDEYCRVRGVTAMTDDELLEVYATHGLAPPLPARGSGELEVVEVPEEEGGSPPSGARTPAEASPAQGAPDDAPTGDPAPPAAQSAPR